MTSQQPPPAVERGKSTIVPKLAGTILSNHYASGGLSNGAEHVGLGWVVTFLVIGLIAAVLGFGGIAGASFAAAKIIFFIALLLLLISIIFGTLGA